jgi:hypothetical protein
MPSSYPSRQNSPDLMNRLVRLIVAAFLLTVSSPSWADTAVVPDSEAVQHIGENVTVEGVVWGVSMITFSKEVRRTKRNAWLTHIIFGAPPPAWTFVGWIPERTPLAGDDSLQSLEGKKIKIRGRIELYQGPNPGTKEPGYPYPIPAIKVLSRSQITEE